MNFNRFSIECELWEHLRASKKKILMYGMGNGADKILAVCERYGVEVCDFFASDGFVRGHSFHGKRVLSYGEAKQKYGAENMIVLLSFATSLPSVLDNITRIANECELYAPDVPVCGDGLFTLDYARAHERELCAVWELLADDASKSIFYNVLLYKLTGKLEYLFEAVSDKSEVMRELVQAEKITSYADLGAYNGDTIRELIALSPRLSYVIAMEPDRRSFRKLGEFCDALGETPRIEKINAAAWSEDAVLSFGDEGNRNSGLFARGKSVDVLATSLDKQLGDRGIDYIKYDVEGCEREALEGSRHTIRKYSPRLLVSVYHKNEDIFSLPLFVHELNENYRLYLRRYPYVPAWDLNLIATPDF